MDIFLKNLPLTLFLISSLGANIALIYRLWFKSEVKNPANILEKDFNTLKDSFDKLKTRFESLEKENAFLSDLEKVDSALYDSIKETNDSIQKEIDGIEQDIKKINTDLLNLWKNKVEHIAYKDDMTKLEQKLDKLQEQQFETILQIKGNQKDAK